MCNTLFFGAKYEIVGKVVSCSFVDEMAFQRFYSEGRRASNSRTLPAVVGGVGGRNSVRSSVCESTPPGRTQPRSRPRNVLPPAQEKTSPLVTRQSRVAYEDALYEPGMPLDALNLPPSTSTQDNFDVSDESDIEQPQPRRLCTSASVHPEGSDIAVMLQQQQGLLLSILANQSKMETKQSEFEAKLLALEEKLSSSISGPSPSSEETKPRKRVVTAALTVSTCIIPSSKST